MSYRSYYLYQKYQSINGSTPMPVYPMEYSYDGEGTMQPVVKSENDVACGYVPPTEPMYQWVVVQGEYICEGYTKYEKMRRQVSYDGGFSWENLDEYTKGNFLQGNSPDCGYIPPSEPIYRWVGTGEYICTDDVPYSAQYVTIESLEDNNKICFCADNSAYTRTISASTDGGNTWTEYTSLTGGSGTVIATLNTGGKVLFKGLNSAYGGRYEEPTNNVNVIRRVYYGNDIYASKRCNIQGNIMSLIYGDNFTGQTTLTASYTFQQMFSGRFVDASNLILPATTLTDYCYNEMFASCTYLKAAPELPATTLVNSCYSSMFSSCYNLNYIKCLATDISATECTKEWVRSVAPSGTFVKASSMSGWTTGTNGIPNNWTVQNA